MSMINKRIVIPMDEETPNNERSMELVRTSFSSPESKRRHPIHFGMSSVISTFYPSSQSVRSPSKYSSWNSSHPRNRSTLEPEKKTRDRLLYRTRTTFTCPFTSTQQQLSNFLNHIDDPNQHGSLQSLLFRFERSFDTSQYTTARTKVTHVIETYPHTPPVSKCYPSNPTSIYEMRSIIDKLVQSGLVRPSNSSYAAAALSTKKKDQT